MQTQETMPYAGGPSGKADPSRISPNIPPRHRIIVDLAERLYGNINGLNVLDLACGHNFPFVSWFQDNNSGPILPGYLASKGATVTGLDEWHFRKSSQFKEHDFQMKWGMAERVRKYFQDNAFDLVISCAFFGYPSSRNGTRPDYQKEFSIMEQLYHLTKEGGYGIHLLADGYWQLEKKDLKSMGYAVEKYLGEDFKQQPHTINEKELEGIIMLRKPFSGK